MTENSQVEAVNCELEFEVERMTDYAKSLQESLENIGKDYTNQFDGYLDRIRNGEQNMENLRQDHASVTKELYQIESTNFLLESELRGLKTEREIEVVKNVHQKIELLKIDTQKMIHNAERMEQAINSAVEQWQDRVASLQQALRQMQSESWMEIHEGLVTKLMQGIRVKNDEIKELTRRRIQIQSEAQAKLTDHELDERQKEIEKLIFDYEQGLADRIEQRKMMC